MLVVSKRNPIESDGMDYKIITIKGEEKPSKVYYQIVNNALKFNRN
jgi:hypothetical protein